MLDSFRKHKLLIFCIFLVGTVLIWWHLVEGKSDQLTVAFLDIGQGDSIFIEAPNGKQMLLDGGKDRSVLARLGEVMPLGDHSIDVMMASHPDADHIGGLPFVLDQYDVGVFMEPGVEASTKTYQSLKDRVKSEGIDTVLARRGMRVVLDERQNIYLDILFPDQDVTHWETNSASIVAKLVYGNESFLLTGDSPQEIENYLLALNAASLKVNVLKLGHHGSRTSSGEAYLRATAPDYAVISAGLHNSYGHPHQEVTDLLAKLKIPSLITFEKGNIIFQTDGKSLRVE